MEDLLLDMAIGTGIVGGSAVVTNYIVKKHINNNDGSDNEKLSNIKELIQEFNKTS